MSQKAHYSRDSTNEIRKRDEWDEKLRPNLSSLKSGTFAGGTYEVFFLAQLSSLLLEKRL